ncbi:serine hydrolase [Haliscomenobacter sp.]|uniref:serine hydrolase n=1 Tax=Haliscomenobacter sp. TaxID=2717303 RepID=UPI0035941293
MKYTYFLFPFLLGAYLCQAQNFSEVDAILQKSLGLYRNDVCVMVNQQSKPIYYRGLGDYDSLSVAAVASVSKTFSGILILALADKGLLSLDDTLGKHLPIFTQYGKGKPTIRQLFSHSSGFPGSETEDYLTSRTMTLEEVANTIAQTENFDYEPGKGFAYGGVSMQIAGRIAEVVTGKSWNQAFREYLADPLGLTQTIFCLNSASNPRIAGGACTSPKDLMILAEFILNKGKHQGKQIISANTMEELWKDQTNKAPQLASPYPDSPKYNNPYGAQTIYYGIGTWQDIYNPTTQYQEQISGAGAFGTYFWVDRVRGLTGVIFTLSLGAITRNATFQIVDAIRDAVSLTTSTVDIRSKENIPVFPNPVRTGQLYSQTVKSGPATLVNAMGRVVMRFNLETLKQGLDVQHLPPGLYFLQSAWGTAKVVILKS